MTQWARAWWHGLPGTAQFRVYTRVTLQAAAVLVVVAFAVPTPDLAAVPGLALTGLVTVVVVEVQPELGSRPGRRLRRIVLPVCVTVLVAVAAVYAVVAGAARTDDVVHGARLVGIFAALALSLAVLPFASHRWWWLVAISVGTGLAYGETWPSRFVLAAILVLFDSFATGSMLLTLFGLRIVDDLEQARTLEARLQVADERLRFARDLHDVVGRGFSAVAVKSELASALARAGEGERAVAEMDAVRALAVESMEQMRQLVRGYRDIDLDGEVAGARSLLAAVGCRLVVEGEPARLPQRFHELAAWVTREGTTNIVRHAAATGATLAFGSAGMSLRNDGLQREMGDRSGLRGLEERAHTVGATLHAATEGDEFVLEIVWTAA